MEELFLWGLVYVIVQMKYMIAYKINTREKISITKMVMFVVVFNTVLIMLIQSFFGGDIPSGCISILAPVSLWALTKEKEHQNWQVLVSFFIVSSIDYIVYETVEYTIDTTRFTEVMRTFIWDGLAFFALVMLESCLVVFRKKEIEFVSKIINLRVSLLIVGVLLSVDAVVIYEKLNYHIFYWGIATLSFVGVIILSVQISKVLDLVSILKQNIEQEHMIRLMQKDYYLTVQEKENELHKYRHDMINHFVVLDSLIDKKKYDKAHKYLEQLKGEFELKTKTKYLVGNNVIDAITEFYVPNIDGYVDVDVEGLVPSDIKYNEISLCTIYSNVLKNAVEELERLKEKGVSDLKLYIEFLTGTMNFRIIVRNSAGINKDFNGVNTKTSKKDYKNHGIGLRSIKQTVCDENGDFKIHQKDGFVCAEVTLPIKMTSENEYSMG
ncbi:MAG: GHKL domain-containing protein [Lachnospiraceae bacterium]|nr:GHKL domain-containing protein [Lachnospiraceae bacterium]